MRQTKPPSDSRAPRVLHACPRCEVTWRGDTATTCWFCGLPGIEAGHARLVVEDENAA
ncbi:MAG: hypothetical protein ACO3PD_08225 [Acidimicrobiales bacterium]